jgi:thiamine biosynthesis lipoprotein
MATSGNYRNFYTTDDGRRVAHTIDPATGYPVQHSILSATVLAPTCAMADAFATSFMVMGLDSARAILSRHPELSVYLIYDQHGSNATFSTIVENQ